MAAPEDILVDNLKEALKAANQYLIWGTGASLFLLILVYQDWRGAGVAAVTTVPAIGVTAERSIVELIAGVACFILSYMAYLAVSRIRRIIWRLRSWPAIRKAALTYPSIPTINTGMRIGAAILPALLFSAALIVIFVPKLKAEDDSFIMVAGIVLMLNAPSILLIQLLRYPLSEVSYMLTTESLEKLKTEGVPEEILERVKVISDKHYANRPMFLKALENTIGKTQVNLRRSILNHACDEEGIED